MHLEMDEVRRSLEDTNIAYVGEGNANLVVALKGRGLILRLPKSKYSDKCLMDKVKTIVTYFNTWMRPYLGDRFLYPVSILAITHQELVDLRSAVRRFRAPFRVAKDIFYPVGILMPDLTSSLSQFTPSMSDSTDLLSIELKPKLGFLLAENSPHPDYCNFCLKQLYKLQQGISDTHSMYCPLDLFSGHPFRMDAALKALMTCPQNNLKMFGNGVLLHSSTTTYVKRTTEFVNGMLGSLANLRNALVTVLLSEYQSHSKHYLKNSHKPLTDDNAQSGRKPETNCDTKSNCDPRINCGKSRTYTHQRLATKVGSIDQAAVQNPTNDQQSQLQDSESDYMKEGEPCLPLGSVLNTVLQLQKQNRITDHQASELLKELVEEGNSHEHIQKQILQPPDDNDEDLRIGELRSYLLYVTAKDLSLFVTFCRADSQSAGDGEGDQKFPTIVVDNQRFWFSIKIVDLDPKPVTRIHKYIQQKEDWLKAANTYKL